MSEFGKNVAALAALPKLTVTELRQRYAEVFGEATRSYNKPHLVKRIAWRLQALHEGDLSQRARQRAAELARDADLRVTAPTSRAVVDGPSVTHPAPAALGVPDDRLPMPGTLLKRTYKGRAIQVRVLPNGFEFEGVVHRSLSAIARQVTGGHWNGYYFFGLQKPTGKEANSA